jgi:hypothetical protein
MQQPSFSATETALIVELTKVPIEVHVHPLDPTLPGHLYGQLYQPTTHSATTDVRVHRGV